MHESMNKRMNGWRRAEAGEASASVARAPSVAADLRQTGVSFYLFYQSRRQNGVTLGALLPPEERVRGGPTHPMACSARCSACSGVRQREGIQSVCSFFVPDGIAYNLGREKSGEDYCKTRRRVWRRGKDRFTFSGQVRDFLLAATSRGIEGNKSLPPMERLAGKAALLPRCVCKEAPRPAYDGFSNAKWTRRYICCWRPRLG